MAKIDHTTPCKGPHKCVGCDTVLDGNVIVCLTCWLGSELGPRINYVSSIDNADTLPPSLHGHAAAALIADVKAGRQRRLDATPAQ